MMIRTRMSKETQSVRAYRSLNTEGEASHTTCLANVASGAARRRRRNPGTVDTRQHSLLIHESIPSELMGQACAAKAP